MSSFLKLCLKSILSYSESFETHLIFGENWMGRGGGGWGVKPEMTNVIFFLFFFNEGFP